MVFTLGTDVGAVWREVESDVNPCVYSPQGDHSATAGPRRLWVSARRLPRTAM